MSLSTFAGLKTAILNEVNRSGDAATVAVVPDWVTLAEADIRREVESRDLTVNTSFSLTSNTVTGPSALGEIESLAINSTLYGWAELEQVPFGRIMHLRAQYPTAAAPAWFAVVDGTIYLAPTPDQTYAATLVYHPEVTALSADDATNYFLTNHSDLYFYGSLLHSIGWLGMGASESDKMTVEFWNSRYQNALQGLKKQKRRHEYGGPLVAIPKRIIGE
jgi:hypothetical protein